MNWEAIGAVGEVAGAIAVVATLAYLTLQVRQSASASQFAARQSLNLQNFEYTRMWLEDPELTQVQYHLIEFGFDQLENPAQLSEQALRRAVGLFYCAFENLASQHQAWRLGLLRDRDWEETFALVEIYVRSPVTRDFWRVLGRNVYHREFVALVDSEAATHEGDKTE